jgi:hypothetical protein
MIHGEAASRPLDASDCCRITLDLRRATLRVWKKKAPRVDCRIGGWFGSLRIVREA